MSQLQTFHVERVSNMSYFNIMKQTSQWKQPNTDKTLAIKDIRV